MNSEDIKERLKKEFTTLQEEAQKLMLERNGLQDKIQAIGVRLNEINGSLKTIIPLITDKSKSKDN